MSLHSISARPGTNGNSEADFQDACAALIDARDALEKAARKVYGDVLNGRNYLHLASGGDAALIRDRRAVQKALTDAAGLIGCALSVIGDALEY